MEENKSIANQLTMDGLRNLITGMGTSLDKATYSEYQYRDNCLDDEELASFYRQHWSAKIIDCKVDDMTRKWRTIQSQSLNPEQIEEIEQYEKKVNLQSQVNWAFKIANVFGGSLIVMHFRGLGDIDTELDWSKITKDSLEKLTVFDRRDISFTSNTKMQNPTSYRYGVPDYYRYNYAPDMRIHPSRTIKILGRPVFNREFIENNYWGDSELERIVDAAKNVDTVTAGINTLIQEANIDVYGIKGLVEMLNQEGGDEKIKDLMEITNLGKSLYRLFIKDAEDTFERKPVNFSTLPDIVETFLDILAGAGEVPKTRLLNQSPSGLSGKGESELTNYYNGIEGKQRSRLRPVLDIIDKALVVSAVGTMPEDYSYEFNPLESEDETERVNNNKTQAETLEILQRVGVPEEALIKDAKENGLTNNLSDDNIESLEFEADNNPEADDVEVDNEK